MKGFRNKMRGLTQRPHDGNPDENAVRSSHDGAPGSPHEDGSPGADVNETPEAMASRLVRTFCMSDVDEAGAEVALLPSIVEVAESSPLAAAQCARFIRKFMYKEYWGRPNFVYNAIMLMRILVENPGMTFTRNLDKKFVDTVRDLLRGCTHAHVVHFLIEALQEFEAKGAVDEGLGRIVEMWQKEKSKTKSFSSRPSRNNQQPQNWVPQGHISTRGQYERGSGGRHSSGTLPRPRELKKRLEEARTTASVLADVVNTNSAQALLKHDLTDDLSSRCRRATAQILEYLNMKEPMPDNKEMTALLATNEALQQSLHHYYRAVLDARKQLGIGEARRSESGDATVEMTPAGKGKGAAPTSPTGEAAGPSGGGSNGHSHSNDSNGVAHAHGSQGGFDPAHYRANSAADDEDMAAAIAASTAPGATTRHPNRYPGGPANDADNPFADNVQAGSSRESSRARPGYGGGGGGAGSTAATGRDVSDIYSDSDSQNDNDGRQRQTGKAAAGGPASSSARPNAHTAGDVSPIEPSEHNYPPAAAGSSAPGVDAAAPSSGKYGSGPVYRY